MLRPVIQPVHEIAAEVIRQTGKDKPADAALREVLKSLRDLAPFDATEIAKTVFIYYRWHVWLREERGVEAKMRLALRLNQRFQSDESSVPFSELRAKAVPRGRRRKWKSATNGSVPCNANPNSGCAPSAERRRRWRKNYWARRSARCCRMPCCIAARKICSRRRNFTRVNLRSRTSRRKLSDALRTVAGRDVVGHLRGRRRKTLHLSDLMQNKGLLWASDRAEWRLQKLKRRTGRAKAFNYRSVFWDGGKKLPTKTKFDGVLVDAPCSGIGTWQRNPQARWTTGENDVRELSAIQKNLLANVAPSVKPGGKLVFSVCTLSRAETTEVAEAFTTSQPDFEPMVFPEIKLNQRTVSDASSLTLWPQDLDGNGMFIAGWRRKKA